MKNSLYNFLLQVDNSNVLYNTLTGNLLLLDPALASLYQNAMNNDAPEQIEARHPSFYEKLQTDRYFVDDDFDEIEEVRQIMNSIDQDTSRYHLVINPTMNCNFKCWYCYESHIKDSKMDLSTIDNIRKHLEHVLTRNSDVKEIIISWFGGEPLLYFDKIMLPIFKDIELLKNKYDVKVSSNITTNGFLINQPMIDHFKTYGLNDFQITLDGNRFLHDTVRFVSSSRGSYDDIVNNIRQLAKNKIRVTARINFTKTNLDGIEEIYEDFAELSEEDRRYLSMSFHKVWQETETKLNGRVEYLVSYFRERGIYARNSYVPDTLRNSCYADKVNHATINYDGQVFKCTARNFSDDNAEGKLNDNGEIVWNQKFHSRMDIKLKNKPCLTCGILPMCNGGCSQVALEAEGKSFCVYDFDHKLKRDLVYAKVKEILL